MVVFIGVLVGAIGVCVTLTTTFLEHLRFGYSERLMQQGQWFFAYITYCFISLGFGLVAGLLCWLVPEAAGSGIPEIKAHLNGVALRGSVRIRVLFAKTIGVCYSVASGLPIGKEG